MSVEGRVFQIVQLRNLEGVVILGPTGETAAPPVSSIVRVASVHAVSQQVAHAQGVEVHAVEGWSGVARYAVSLSEEQQCPCLLMIAQRCCFSPQVPLKGRLVRQECTLGGSNG